MLTGAGAVLTQGLHASDLFVMDGDHVRAILHPLETAVRAVVMPLPDSLASARLKEALLNHLLPIVPPDGIWMQDETMLHTTLFHASSFQVGHVCNNHCCCLCLLDRALPAAAGIQSTLLAT